MCTVQTNSRANDPRTEPHHQSRTENAMVVSYSLNIHEIAQLLHLMPNLSTPRVNYLQKLINCIHNITISVKMFAIVYILNW